MVNSTRLNYTKLITVCLPLLVVALFLTSCDSSNSQKDFPIPNKSDIEEIVKTIVIQDSLSAYDSPLSKDLRKLTVFVPDPKTTIPPPIDHYRLSINDLFDKRYKDSGHFNKEDSLYFIFQNDTLKHFGLEASLVPQIKLTASDNLHVNGDRYIDLSIPIFSLDQQKAYVQLNRFCPFCGSGNAIFLEKKNGRWKILKQSMTWIN